MWTPFDSNIVTIHVKIHHIVVPPLPWPDGVKSILAIWSASFQSESPAVSSGHTYNIYSMLDFHVYINLKPGTCTFRPNNGLDPATHYVSTQTFNAVTPLHLDSLMHFILNKEQSRKSTPPPSLANTPTKPPPFAWLQTVYNSLYWEDIRPAHSQQPTAHHQNWLLTSERSWSGWTMFGPCEWMWCHFHAFTHIKKELRKNKKNATFSGQDLYLTSIWKNYPVTQLNFYQQHLWQQLKSACYNRINSGEPPSVSTRQ